jgi:phage tail tape-measure protein
MTIEEAGEYYLDWVCQSNAAADRFDKLTRGKLYRDLVQRKYRDAALRAARAQRETAQALDSPPAPWPDEVAKPISGVVQSLLDDVSTYRALSKVRTEAQAIAAYDRLGRGKNTAAQTARLRLGLPPAGAKDGCRNRVAPSPTP